MKYKTYNCNSYNIHTIKTDRFKTAHIEIIFRKNVCKSELASYTILCDLLTDSCKKYPTRREFTMHLEDLYNTFLYGTTTKVGNMFVMNIMSDFISPKYINDEAYLNNYLFTIFDIFNNPNTNNNEFDKNKVEINKKRLSEDIKSLEEDGTRLSIYNALNIMDNNSITACRSHGNIEDIESITPSSLYKLYKDLYKNNLCDIFVIGDLDMDKVVEIIKNNFNNNIINNDEVNINVLNKIKKREVKVVEQSTFSQANLVMIYNVDNLSKYEKHNIMPIYNYIVGSGGLNSKLYNEIREKNSYTYAVDTMFMRYDNIYIIHISLDNKNVEDTIKLVKKIIKDSANKLISESDLEDAKKNLEMALNMNYDSPVSLINNYLFQIIDDLDDLETKIKKLKKVKLEEILNVAKKLKLNTTYIMEGEK